MNGIGASLEVLQPFVDALDTRRTVDPLRRPRRRRLAAAGRPLQPGDVQPGGRRDARPAGVRRAGRRPRAVLGRRAGPALRRPAPAAGAGGWCSPPPRPDRSWCRPTRGCWPGCSPRGGTGTPSTRAASPVRSTAARCAPTPSGRPTPCTRDPARPAARLLLPAGRQPGLEQPAVPEADPAADAASSPGTTTRSCPVVNARIMARLLPDARLHVYDGGHIALVTEAARARAGDRGVPRQLTARSGPTGKLSHPAATIGLPRRMHRGCSVTAPSRSRAVITAASSGSGSDDRAAGGRLPARLRTPGGPCWSRRSRTGQAPAAA